MARGGEDEQAAGPGPGSEAQFTQRKSLLPKSWQRLQQQVTGKKPESLPELPVSGANVTLRDLARETQRHLEESGAESEGAFSSSTEEEEEGQQGREGSKKGKPVSGWLGRPDPRKYAASTNRLSPQELEQEVKAGNVVALHDMQGAIQQLQPWEQKMLFYEVLADYVKNRMFVELDTASDAGDEPAEPISSRSTKRAKAPGNMVSLWDLYRYVHHNPELEKLARSHRQVVDGPEGSERRVPTHMAPFTGEPGNPYAMDLPPEVIQELPWVLVAQGDVWKRRPTRWLKGIDGKRDFQYGVYVHEEMTHELLGPKYEGLNPQRVASSEQYWQDVLQAGPKLGMTYMVAAARDVPVADTARSWGDRLCSRLQARGLPSPSTDPPSGMQALSLALSPSTLYQQTRLLTEGGSHLRAGSALFITALPKGNVVLHAMSADPVATREYYSLGSFKDEAVSGALGSLFLGGPPGRLEQEPPLDEQVLRQAPRNILMAAQGIKMGAHTQPTGVKPPPPFLGSAAFHLPALGSVSRTRHEHAFDSPTPPSLVSGISQDVAQVRLLRVFQEASQAARAAAPPGPGAEAAAARRQAAEQVLHTGLQQLGVDVNGLSLVRGSSGVPQAVQQYGPGSQQQQQQQQQQQGQQEWGGGGGARSDGSSGNGGMHQGQLMHPMEQAQQQQQQQQQQPEGVFGAAEPLAASVQSSGLAPSEVAKQ